MLNNLWSDINILLSITYVYCKVFSTWYDFIIGGWFLIIISCTFYIPYIANEREEEREGGRERGRDGEREEDWETEIEVDRGNRGREGRKEGVRDGEWVTEREGEEGWQRENKWEIDKK